MRKLKLQVQISIDGFIAGPNGEMDWMATDWSDDIKQYIDGITRPVDTILLGRNLAAEFIPYWAAVAKDDSNPEKEAGIKFTETPKIVFSRTLTQSEWENTAVENGDFVEKINALKQQPDSDMIAYGGAEFVSSLIREQLIDELYLFVNPAVLGKGMPIFQEVRSVQKPDPVLSEHFDCGITVLVYRLR